MTLIRTLALSVMSMLSVMALALALGFSNAQAQTASGYPQKPVHMIIPFAPGGASDFVGRIISPRLSEALPQVPTMVEAGYPDFVTSSWQGVFVAAGTPRGVVAKLREALVKVLAMPEVKERFASGGVMATASKTPEDFAAYVAAESGRWGKVARESGATID